MTATGRLSKQKKIKAGRQAYIFNLLQLKISLGLLPLLYLLLLPANTHTLSKRPR
jgi:hypothetical protein